MFSGPEHDVLNAKPHGNSKSKLPYRRILPSTREKMKRSVLDGKKTATAALDEIYSSSGDVTMARSLGELPRGPVDMYNARRSARQSLDTASGFSGEAEQGTMANMRLDDVWTLLERAKREEDESKHNVFIRECSIHPSLFVVLANNVQLDELKKFCTNPMNFCIFGIDPTFNIFDKNISLTVTTYRNLKLEQTTTGKPPVFIGPLLMHQKKDWKTYSKFAHALKTANPELEGILACGTDGEKALSDGFKRNFPYAIFLRCFLHVKDNINRELTDRGVSPSARKQFIADIFGEQRGEVMYTGLVDSACADEFDEKLAYLEEEWKERESGSKEKNLTFFEWFRREKVTVI